MSLRWLPVLVTVTFLLVSNHALGAGEQPSATRKSTDKTLIAWVYLTDLKQRGGSALTLFDERERFDAVVFGECAAGKWMAGSDFFHRTSQSQSAWPTETADENTLVKMAVVYRGNQIAIYRNDHLYAQYSVDRPQAFDTDATVLLGLRYKGQMGAIGFLRGVIEEARIYNKALDDDAIAALKPNQPSTPQPLGQWTFEDGTASDSMGTFPQGELCGRARILDGKLHLDGETAYLEVYRPRPLVVQDMFYKARSRRTGNMWDTWLYLHEGRYYLYYLANSGPAWDNISMATSPDGVHWREHGRVLEKREDSTWMGTGSTWKSPAHDRDGKFFINFSEWRGPRQTIFFAESTDLLNWTKLSTDLEFKQDTRWYEPQGRWDCIYTITRPAGGLFGYWTATPKPETGGRFGFGQTLDGVTWKALQPPKTPGVAEGEVGAVEKIGDKCYMMFGSGGLMVTLVADRPQGPFLPAKKNLRLLSGHTYFSRFFPTPDGMLVNHHAISRTAAGVSFGLLKSARVDEEHTLRLGWWTGNEKLKHQEIDVRTSPDSGAPIAMLETTFNVKQGVILEGTLALPESKDSPRRGLYLECGENTGTALLLDHRGAAELGTIGADALGFTVEKQVDRELQYGSPTRFRLLLKDSLTEFYLDDILIECFSLPGDATGRIGLIGGDSVKPIGNLKAWK